VGGLRVWGAGVGPDSPGWISEAGEWLCRYSQNSYVARVTADAGRRNGAAAGERRAPRRSVCPGRGALLSSAPTSGQRRCLGAAPGGCAACLVRPGRRPGAEGAHGWSRPLTVRKCKQCSCLRRDLGRCTHRAGWAGPTQPFHPRLCIFAFSAGRPRASPEPTVLLGDRAAVPCRPATSLERGPTTYGTTRTSHRSSKPRVVLSGPPLAGTDISTNEAVRTPVTRRTG
jgi:hypothetical protein